VWKEDFLVYCSYSETEIATVLKFVARIRLVETQNLSVCMCMSVCLCVCNGVL
jgi:hypothetical protein